jgi:hypothetical protein
MMAKLPRPLLLNVIFSFFHFLIFSFLYLSLRVVEVAVALAFAFAFVAIAVFLLFVAGKWWFFHFVAWGDGGKIVSLYGYTAGHLAVAP